MRKSNKKKVIIVYGSGASYASGYKVALEQSRLEKLLMVNEGEINPPMDRSFFKNINSTSLKSKFPALQKFVKLYYKNIDSLGLEEVWSSVDLNQKHITLGTYDWKRETARYVQDYAVKGSSMDSRQKVMDRKPNSPEFNPEFNRYKFLGDCGRDLRVLISKLYGNYNSPDVKNNKYFALHETVKNHISGYITFNYDCFLEDSLTHTRQRFKYIDPSVDVDSIDALSYGFKPIIKLHGSLNWEEKIVDGYADLTIKGQPYNKQGQVNIKYENDSNYVQPAIIPPTAFKQEINDDARASDIKTRFLMKQWKAAITLLSDATHIVFAGYSFPDTDFHAKRLFKLATLGRVKEQQQKVLYCCGPDDNIREQYEKLLFLNIRRKNIMVVKDFNNLSQAKNIGKFLKK